MQKQLTTWIQIREIFIFLLIWPIIPIALSFLGGMHIFYLNPVLLICFTLYKFLGWIIAALVYGRRMKQYVRVNKPYSPMKELGLFFLIWPISPILIYTIMYLIAFVFRGAEIVIGILMMISLYGLIFGWMPALFVYYGRRRNYFKETMMEQKKKKNASRFIPALVVVTVLGCFVYFMVSQITGFLDDGHRDFAPSGAKIRLEISEEECSQYPNRYYFKNLCILCPDEQPMVDGHCQRCPSNQFVISNGCRDCDSSWNYITPKEECDACPNRVYEDGLCKLRYKTFGREEENFGFSSGHRDFTPNGGKIRLEISEEECKQYPNRYYFKNLCILCPDEQPMVDGHCQRCPGNQFVISNGCRDCDDDNNYITPKAECDACPGRIYEGGLCKLRYRNNGRFCHEEYPWKGTKEECDACEHRRYTEEGLCEKWLDGWITDTAHMVTAPAHMDARRMDSFYKDNVLLKRRHYDKNNRLIYENYYTYDGDITHTRDKYTTFFPDGHIRTKVDHNSMVGYYKNGTLAFERKNEIVKFYDEQGEKIGFGSLTKRHGSYVPVEIYVLQGDDYYPLDDVALMEYFKENYPIDFELPFELAIPESKEHTYPIHYLRYNSEANKKFEENILTLHHF